MNSREKMWMALILAGMAACAPTGAAGSESAARAVVDDFWHAITSQDVELLSQVVAQDEEMVIYGTDASERWIGSASYLAAEAQMMQVFDVEELSRLEDTFSISLSGEVAWFSTVFDIAITVDGERSEFRGLRTTGVLEKRAAGWKLVQSHTSVPVSGQQVEY